MSLTSLRLPEHLTRWLDDIATRRRISRSAVVREALEQYCASGQASADLDPVALVEQLVDYTGSGRGDLGRHGEQYLRELFGERRRRRTG
jgi:Arc/MetJ-type ribon-helix-helix transcriptional regulator